MKLNFSRNDFKDAFIGMVILSIILSVLYCAILLLPNQFGVHDEWKVTLLATTKEHWPIFLGGIMVISLFYSILELVKKIKKRHK